MKGEEITNSISAEIARIAETDISYADHDDKSNLTEAEAIKNEYCAYLTSVLSKAAGIYDTLEDFELERFQRKFTEALVPVNDLVKGAVRLFTEVGVHTEKFPTDRNRLIESIRNSWSSLPGTLEYINEKIKLERAHAFSAEDNRLHAAAKESSELVNKTRDHEKKAEEILEKLRDKLTKFGIDRDISTFQGRSKTHALYGIWWLGFSIAFFILSAMVVAILVFDPYCMFKLPEQPSWSILTQRLLLLSIPAIALKICLTKYNMERNLRILYDHRTAVLEQFQLLIDTVSDPGVKDALRLELAKYLFSDPQTGYVKDSSNKDTSIIPINPVIDPFKKN